ncbi:hypothetical protein PO878_08910 [Iamia majanohamensis]|uniref:Uncharacterized protein n=1 Tax=Iamia majanohamensis TaxID=467976 RepID=A0AAF0BVG2_9ACTN|nr:hypothetical protein [Iamia majanohamensis]WCO68842.1 hypothetical protein PO878_08910 [Iamia majanohamensis]
MEIQAHGIRAQLPAGWEGRLGKRAATGPAERRKGGTTAVSEDTGPVLHMANFALPEDRGDFGSGAVDVMGTGHVLVAVVEYGPDSAGTALFPTVSRVPRLTTRMFSTQALQRVQRGQAGAQRFFTLNGRAFCLYVVLGDQRDAAELTPRTNDLTSQIEVTPR